MSTYNARICAALGITPERARLVEGFLRLERRGLDSLNDNAIRREYACGISEAIDSDPAVAERLAASFGLPSVSGVVDTTAALVAAVNRGE